MKSIKKHLEELDPGHGAAIAKGVRKNWEQRRLRELRNEVKPINWEHGSNFEISLRQKLGCYTKCDGFNSSCHLTCIEYEQEVLPKLRSKI